MSFTTSLAGRFSTIQYNTTVKYSTRRNTASDCFSTIQYNTTVKSGLPPFSQKTSFSTIQYNTTVKLYGQQAKAG